MVYREPKPSQLFRILMVASKSTAIVMFLIAAAMVSAWLITVADLPSKVVGMLLPLLDSPRLLFIILFAIVLFLWLVTWPARLFHG